MKRLIIIVYLNDCMIKSLNFLPHSGKENGDPLDHDERHDLEHQEDGAVLHEAHDWDRRGAENLVETRRILLREIHFLR